ncbi:MAG: hypothetical protein M3N46_03145 [Actinomycetota bacterium]|nr:hypothetical protein [Actinomycetota bacterium]
MNDTATPRTVETPRGPLHPPQPIPQQYLPQPARRVGLLDRAALHLGLALIRWGRRPDPEPARLERRATRIERALHAIEQDTLLERMRAELADCAGPRRLG